MAKLKYTVRGYSPVASKLNYKSEDGALISIRSVNFKLRIKSNNNQDLITGEVICEIGGPGAGFYKFKKNGQKKLVESFTSVPNDYNIDIDSKIIMLNNPDKMALWIYVTVKDKDGNSFPRPISKGRYVWDRGDVMIPLDNLIDRLNGLNINLNQIL